MSRTHTTFRAEREVKQAVSKIPVNVTLGFLYWLAETHNLRGLKEESIEEYPVKIESLLELYEEKYPNGLTGWSSGL